MRQLFFVLLLFSSTLYAQAQPQLPTQTLTIGAHRIIAEIANTPEQRERGLMHRFTMPAGQGMLFVFPEPHLLGFWMKNTPSPLSIAFIDGDGVILNIEDMAPNDDKTIHRSHGNALYALEMRQGWFLEQGIKPGDKVGNLPGASKN